MAKDDSKLDALNALLPTGLIPVEALQPLSIDNSQKPQGLDSNESFILKRLGAYTCPIITAAEVDSIWQAAYLAAIPLSDTEPGKSEHGYLISDHFKKGKT